MNESMIRAITEQVLRQLKRADENLIPIGVSNRHVHLCKEHLDLLFGKNHPLTFKKELMGGQFAAAETVTLLSSKMKTIGMVRVLGPLRDASQVEISKTDAFTLGINPPVRESGHLSGSVPITLIGPAGSVSLTEGCILAQRHIHMSTEDARRFGVSDHDMVEVQAGCSQRGGILKQVLVRVDDSFTLELHLDTDEANGLGIATGTMGIIKP